MTNSDCCLSFTDTVMPVLVAGMGVVLLVGTWVLFIKGWCNFQLFS